MTQPKHIREILRRLKGKGISPTVAPAGSTHWHLRHKGTFVTVSSSPNSVEQCVKIKTAQALRVFGGVA